MESQAAPSSSGTVCAHHENLPAIFICRRCHTPICNLCATPQDDGSRLCPACAPQSSPPTLHAGLPPVTLSVREQKCKQHPNVAAVQICRTCGAPMCATCDFQLPGNLHYCPACATATHTTMSPGRKKRLIGSFAMAMWCMVILALLVGGAFRSLARDQASQTALGFLMLILLLLPAALGVALGVSSKGRRPGTVAIWIAIFWNGLILGGFVLLIIIGVLSKG